MKSKRLRCRTVGLFIVSLAGAGLVSEHARGQVPSRVIIRSSTHSSEVTDSLSSDKRTALLLRTANEKGSAGDWQGAADDLSAAIQIAPDSMRALPYAERSSLYMARKRFTSALADLDSAIAYTPRLHYNGMYSAGTHNAHLRAYWRWKAHIFAEMGQYEQALASVDQADRLLPAEPFPKYAESVGSNLVARGRYLTLQGNLPAAEATYRKAIDAYEKAERSPVGIRLKVVELCLLTGQYDRAERMLDNLTDKQLGQLNQGYENLNEYLRQCLAVLSNRQTGNQAVTHLKIAFDRQPQTLFYPFTLTDTWLAYRNVNQRIIERFRQLQRVAQLRLTQPR